MVPECDACPDVSLSPVDGSVMQGHSRNRDHVFVLNRLSPPGRASEDGMTDVIRAVHPGLGWAVQTGHLGDGCGTAPSAVEALVISTQVQHFMSLSKGQPIVTGSWSKAGLCKFHSH